MDSPEIDCNCDVKKVKIDYDGTIFSECAACHAQYDANGDFIKYEDE